MKERVARRGSGKMNKNDGIITTNIDIYEGSDYFLDMEMSILKKKRSRSEMLFVCDDNGADEVYVSFLKGLHNFWEAKFEEEDDDDPVYSAFLENLKEYGNAYMCDVSKENGVLLPIIYEEESVSPYEIKRKTPQTHSGTSIREKRKVCPDCKQRSGSKYAVVGKKTYTQIDENYKKKLKSEQKSGPIVAGVVKKTSTLLDETYGEFLKNLHVTKESVFYEYGDQKRIFYDVGDQQIAEIKPLKRVMRSLPSSSAPITGPSTPPSTENISSSKKSTPTNGHDTMSSSFCMLSASNGTHQNKELSEENYSSYWMTRTELLDDLRKPFKKKEYDYLWEQFATQKPVSIYRDSRSGGSYRPGHMGKSYLDLYPDLQHEIDKVKSDLPKVLNLLRMFKYYIEKIPSIPNKVPKPWMDDFTKLILPEGRRRLEPFPGFERLYGSFCDE